MTISQHQYNGLSVNESLEDTLDQHVDGMANELAEISEFTAFNNVRVVSLVTKGNNDYVIDKTYQNIGKQTILSNLRSELNAVWEPDYETDIKVGAGTTVKLSD